MTGAARLIILALLISGTCLSRAAPAQADLYVGGAATRGFFGWAAIGGLSYSPQTIETRGEITFPLKVEGMFSVRDNVTNVVLSAIPTISYVPPGFEGNDFVPFVSTGPGFHFQGAWSDLQEFGGVETQSNSVAKWHVYFGASLARGRTVDLMVETRYTTPSELNFDYVYLGLSFHPERL